MLSWGAGGLDFAVMLMQTFAGAHITGPMTVLLAQSTLPMTMVRPVVSMHACLGGVVCVSLFLYLARCVPPLRVYICASQPCRAIFVVLGLDIVGRRARAAAVCSYSARGALRPRGIVVVSACGALLPRGIVVFRYYLWPK